MLPPGASSYAAEVDRLFWTILLITGFFFFLVQAGLLLFVLRYRARPDRKAAYVHGSVWVEVVWTVIPALILLALTIASQKTWVEIRSPRQRPETPFQAEILAEQFAWNVRYPGPDRQLNTSDDVTTLNQLHLPLRQPTLLTIRSKDVIHSFFVPQFRMKQDAVPGLTTRLWVNLTKAGHYEIACAELCGLGHYRMRGFVVVEPPEALAAWLAQQLAEQ